MGLFYVDRQAEWTKAKNLFAALSEAERQPGKKIKRGEDSDLQHSFLLTQGGRLLAMSDKTDGILGIGGHSRVKLAEDEDGNLYALKILSGAKQDDKWVEGEIGDAYDLGVSAEERATYRPSKNTVKAYLPLIYLGRPLSYLDKDTLTDDEALRIAIQLAVLLEDYYHGKLSKTGKSYGYHGDLKPSNITIDEKGHLHLIDFGGGGSTPGYSADGNELFCYLKTIFIPLHLQYRDCVWVNVGILSHYLVNQSPELAKLLDALDQDRKKQVSLLEIAGVLTRARCQLNDSVPLDTVEAIREANKHHENTLIHLKDDMVTKELPSVITKSREALEVFLERLDENSIIHSLKQIDDVNHEKMRLLEQIEVIAQPILTALSQLDQQTRRSSCAGYYYLARYTVEVKTDVRIKTILRRQSDAEKSRENISKLNLDDIANLKNYTALQKYTTQLYKDFNIIDRYKTYISDFSTFSTIEEKKKVSMRAIVKQAATLGLSLGLSLRPSNDESLDFTSEQDQKALVNAVCQIKDETLAHACVVELSAMQPILSAFNDESYDNRILKNCIENGDFRKIITILIANHLLPDSQMAGYYFSNLIEDPENSKKALPVLEWAVNQKKLLSQSQVNQYLKHTYLLTPLLLKKMPQPEVSAEEIKKIFEYNEADLDKKEKYMKGLEPQLKKLLLDLKAVPHQSKTENKIIETICVEIDTLWKECKENTIDPSSFVEQARAKTNSACGELKHNKEASLLLIGLLALIPILGWAALVYYGYDKKQAANRFTLFQEAIAQSPLKKDTPDIPHQEIINPKLI